MPDTVGERLAAARRSSGKTLVEIEAATRIRAKMLEALEKGQYDKLPSPAYIRGYIISVSKFLELDPGPLLEAYASETGNRTNREQLRTPIPVVPTRERQHAIPPRTALLIAGAIVALVLAVWLIGRIANGPEKLPPVPNVPEASQTAQPTIT
ncbi:helix-turn-helix domain-containing protein, partial [bacterium]|nr:helix-turn-helix domain-containing protein [bacterium]